MAKFNACYLFSLLNGTSKIWQNGTKPGVWGQNPQPPTNFYGFRIKNTHLSTLFIEKVCIVPAVGAISTGPAPRLDPPPIDMLGPSNQQTYSFETKGGCNFLSFSVFDWMTCRCVLFATTVGPAGGMASRLFLNALMPLVLGLNSRGPVCTTRNKIQS